MSAEWAIVVVLALSGFTIFRTLEKIAQHLLEIKRLYANSAEQRID